MTLEMWIYAYFLCGIILGVTSVLVMKKIDPVTGEDNWELVGLPVVVGWPIVLAALTIVVVVNLVRKIRTG